MIDLGESLRKARGPFRRTFLRVRNDVRGVVAIEFALCGAAFIALLLACLETALYFFAQENIQTAAESTARKVLTGQLQSSKTSIADFRTAACTDLPSFMSCSRLIIDVRKAPTFSAVDTSNPKITYDSSGNPTNTWSYDTGSSGDIVILRLMYIWPVSFSPMSYKLGDSNGNALLKGTMVFKSELYS